MNKHDIHLLQQLRGYPSLTITLPTHRTSPDNKQDPIRVKNLVLQASNRLLEEFGKREIEPLLARLEKLANDIDYPQTLDGLALFVNHDFARAFYLPFTLAERVIVDESFFTRDLVFALNRTPRYWVLALSEKPTRLFEATRESFTEITADGFPVNHGGAGGSTALPKSPNINVSAYRDESHRQFFRHVDDLLKPFMADDALPLAVVGVDRYLAFFDEVSAHKSHIVAKLTGSHDKTAAHDLGQLVWPLVEEGLAARREVHLQTLEKALGERKFASTIGEAWRMAHEGRGRLLLVEEDFHYPARLDETGLILTPADDPTAPDVLDDAVDDLIEMVLAKQGEVVFVENGRLADHQRVSLVLRY